MLGVTDTVQVVGDNVDGEVLRTIHESMSIAGIYPANEVASNGDNTGCILYLLADDDNGKQRREYPHRRIRRSVNNTI